MTVKAELLDETGRVKQLTWVGPEDVARLSGLIGQDVQDVSVFGDGFSSWLGEREVAGGVFVWEGPRVTLDGREIPADGYSLCRGQTATFRPEVGSEVEIRIIQNVDPRASMFDSLGPVTEGDIVIFTGLPLGEQK